MDIRATRTCEKCGNVVPLDKIRIVSKGKNQTAVLCADCAAKQSTTTGALRSEESAAYIRERASLADSKKRTVSQAQQRSVDRISLTCTRCNYKFAVDRNKANIQYNVVCPYCGKADRITPPLS